jgi:uncharacterized membrane protein YraQ (UPF0718 family)
MGDNEDRLTKLETSRQFDREDITEIKIQLSKMNENLSSFTQELKLLAAQSHSQHQCKADIKKEVKAEILEHFKNIGSFTILIGIIIGGIASWIRWGHR